MGTLIDCLLFIFRWCFLQVHTWERLARRDSSRHARQLHGVTTEHVSIVEFYDQYVRLVGTCRQGRIGSLYHIG